MKWKLVNITQETFHPFLNYFTLTYDVEKEDGSHSTYPYYMVSRRSKDELLALTHKYHKPDGVVMPLYYVNPNTKEISLLFTKQFRPAIGTTMMSFPAGLVDPNDPDIFTTVRREAKEEAGVEIADMEMLTETGPTSTGLSDELNCSVLARITSFGTNSLEEYEDIRTELIPLAKIPALLKPNQEYYFPMNIRLMLLYLLERFKN